MTAISTPTTDTSAGLPTEIEAPVITQIPTTPAEIAEIGSELSKLGSPIVGAQANGVAPLASAYEWNLSNDFNVNWRTTGPPPGLGTPAAGHRPSCASRDLFVAWTPPA